MAAFRPASSFREYLRALSDEDLAGYYLGIEESRRFPELIAKEYGRRFRGTPAEKILERMQPPPGLARHRDDILERLSTNAGALSRMVSEYASAATQATADIGQAAARAGSKVGGQIVSETQAGISGGMKTARRMTVSQKNADLLAKLGELQKSGVITAKEFREKKKDLLDRI